MSSMRSLPLQNLIPPRNPALNGRLTKIDFLGLMATCIGIKQNPNILVSKYSKKIVGLNQNALLQFCFCLLFGAASYSGNASLCRTIQNVLSINGALAQSSPAFRVVITLILRLGLDSSNVVLERTEI
jgi:hypothetical protein